MFRRLSYNMEQSTSVVIIGAGLTGLTTAYCLARKGVEVHVVEKNHHVGGQIRTHHDKGFVFESGPTTGSVSTPEVAELMADLEQTSGGYCVLETAPDAAKRRLIWKGERFRDLPSGLFSAIATPLFRFSDKIRILGEPWRKKGDNPNETVGDMTRRRLGRSFVDYAVDPFLSGVYAGNPDLLVTRYALPKLYNLEQNYGSFIRGSIAKARETKTQRDRLATKKVFSARGGLSQIIDAEADFIGREHIALGVGEVSVKPDGQGGWLTTYVDNQGTRQTVRSLQVVTTCGAYALPELLPFADKAIVQDIAALRYAPVMEVNVGLNDAHGGDYMAFGGLVPSCERRRVLGVLYPSACFQGRAPEGGVLFAFFLGGMRHPEMLAMSDDEVRQLVTDELHHMLKVPAQVAPDLIHISRHEKAIPQYEASTGDRLVAVDKLQRQFPGLTIGGNLRDGIGMAHRITQATNIANSIFEKYFAK